MTRRRILVVDDEPHMIWLLKETFAPEFEIRGAKGGEEALEAMGKERFDLVLLDLRLHQENGVGVLQKIKQFSPAIPVIMITAYASVPTAVEAMKSGAYDYVTKPFDLEELRLLICRALHLVQEKEADPEASEIAAEFSRNQIVAESKEMFEVWRLIQKVAPTEASVLILGESGTGKELVARALHAESPRRGKPFIPINCAALPENLLESELFGYEEGAFTGARGKKPGKFELAHGGTLLLDEIGDMPLGIQAKLLRVLEEGMVERLGSTKRIPVDVRIVACTNQDLLAQMEKRKFRRDLYFRLAAFPILLPPLRKRREDIPALARHFLECYATKYGREVKGFRPAVLEIFSRYPWPGNVRELRNLVEQLVILAEDPLIRVEDLPATFGVLSHWETQEEVEGPFRSKEEKVGLLPRKEEFTSGKFTGLRESREEIERRAITEALRICGGNRTQAAQLLGISRRTLQLKLKELGLQNYL